MKNRSIDPWLILTSTLLIVFGLILVYSASAMKAFERTGDETYYLTRQLIALAVGMVLCVSTAVTPMRIIRRYRVAIYVAVLAGLVLCFVPGIRYGANGAYRWIGFGPVHWQPSEFAKIIAAGIQAMVGWKDEAGRPVNGGAREFVVMVSPNMMAAAFGATVGELLLAGGGPRLDKSAGRGGYVRALRVPSLAEAWRVQAPPRVEVLLAQEERILVGCTLGDLIELDRAGQRVRAFAAPAESLGRGAADFASRKGVVVSARVHSTDLRSSTSGTRSPSISFIASGSWTRRPRSSTLASRS